MPAVTTSGTSSSSKNTIAISSSITADGKISSSKLPAINSSELNVYTGAQRGAASSKLQNQQTDSVMNAENRSKTGGGKPLGKTSVGEIDKGRRGGGEHPLMMSCLFVCLSLFIYVCLNVCLSV